MHFILLPTIDITLLLLPIKWRYDILTARRLYNNKPLPLDTVLQYYK